MGKNEACREAIDDILRMHKERIQQDDFADPDGAHIFLNTDERKRIEIEISVLERVLAKARGTS